MKQKEGREKVKAIFQVAGKNVLSKDEWLAALKVVIFIKKEQNIYTFPDLKINGFLALYKVPCSLFIFSAFSSFCDLWKGQSKRIFASFN